MADPMTPERWFLSDVDGRLEIWREAVLLDVTRDEHGEIDSYRTPSSWKVGDLIMGRDLDTWDEGMDEADDKRREIAARMVADHNEVERLRAELAKRPKSRLGEQVNRLSNAVGDLERERDDALAEVERLRAELAETTHALEVTGEKVTALRKQRDQAEAERDQARAELAAIHTTETDVTWLADGVRRLILGVSVRTAKDASAAQYTIAQEVASHINAGILTAFVSSRIVDLSVEYVRQAKAEQAKDTEQAVHAYFADADQRGIHLDGMTVDELCDAVMAAIREGTGQ